MNIYEKTAQIIPQLEKSEGIRILHVCESGSRAWGFPSPNSDYDIRFIYCRPVEWYACLGHEKDTMEWFAEDRLLDFSGWDIRKVLAHFAECNPMLNEHINSPVMYYHSGDFINRLREMIPAWFRPIKGMHHYWSSARSRLTELGEAEEIKIKKFFYIARPLICCAWIDLTGTMPPTEFVPQLELPIFRQPEFAGFRETILDLIERKKTLEEAGLIPFTGDLRRWTLTLYDLMTARTEESKKKYTNTTTPGIEPLNELLLETLSTPMKGGNECEGHVSDLNGVTLLCPRQ